MKCCGSECIPILTTLSGNVGALRGCQGQQLGVVFPAGTHWLPRSCATQDRAKPCGPIAPCGARMEAPLPASAISFSMRWVNSANLVHSAAQFVGTAMIVVVVIVGLPLHRPVDAEPIQILEGIRGNFWLADDLLRGRASGPALAQPSVRTPAPASCYERL